MASKKNQGALRGAALVKAAIASATEKGTIAEPTPVPPGILKKLRLPNDEKISPAMKAFFAFDASYFGFEFDDEEPEFEAMAVEDIVEQELGEESVPRFGEAYDLLGDDCLLLGEGVEPPRFLYIGTPDSAGEYPVITLETNAEGAAVVRGFVPFDVWLAQELGALPKELSEEHLAAVKELADSNGDGRTSFEPKAKEAGEGDDDEDEDEDEDDDKEDSKNA